MRPRRSRGWSWLAPLFVVAIVLMLWREQSTAPHESNAGVRVPASPDSTEGLPGEARQTLELIATRGPFPYDRDGTVFQNRERRLPERPSGYYREYTVPTPGERDRGARRIVTGGDPPEVYYYTDDHYETFRRLEGVNGRR